MKKMHFVLTIIFLIIGMNIHAQDIPGQEIKRPSRWFLFFDLEKTAGTNGVILNQSEAINTISLSTVSNARASALGEIDYVNTIYRYYTGSFSTIEEFEKAYENAAIIYDTLKLTTEREILNLVAQRTKGHSFVEKMHVVATFLDKFSENYNNKRNDFDNEDSKSSVNLRQLLSAIDSNLNLGTSIDAGVCRDMHFGAAKLAKAMGVDEAFVLSYATNETSHMMLIASDPNDRGTVFSENYGRITIKDGVAGVEALFQNGTLPEAGITYRIWRANNTMAMALPTEKGVVLNRVTGGSDSDLDPFLRNNSTIIQGGAQTKYGTIRIFGSENNLGNEEKMQGVAYNKEIEYFKRRQNLRLTGSYGIAGFSSERKTFRGNLESNGIYVQVGHKLEHDIYKGSKGALTNTANLIGRGMVGFNKQTFASEAQADKTVSPDGSIDLFLGSQFTYGNKNAQHITGINTQFQLGFLDGRNLFSGPMLYPGTTYIFHNSNFKVSKKLKGSVDLAIGTRHLGNSSPYLQYRAGAGLSSKTGNFRARVGSQGAISNSLPYWVPGSEREANVLLQQRLFKDKLHLTIQGRQSLEDINNHVGTIGIGGNF